MIDKFLRKIPYAGKWLSGVYNRLRGVPAFSSSGEYWENRYRDGGNSGAGSYDKFAVYKGEVINEFIRKNHIRSVIEFGCGDGNQLGYFHVDRYLGFDVSETAIGICRRRYGSDPGKEFRLMEDYAGESAGLTVSLDVIYHLVEDLVFESYMRLLFSASERFVIVYSSDYEEDEKLTAAHVKLRKFTDWVKEHATDFTLAEHLPNPYPFDGNNRNTTISDFYIFRKKDVI